MIYGKVDGRYIASPEVGAGRGCSLWPWVVSSSLIFDYNKGWTTEGVSFFLGRTIQGVCNLEVVVMCGELCRHEQV